MDTADEGPFDHGVLARMIDGDWRATTCLTAALPGGAPAPSAYELMERGRELGLDLEPRDAEDGALCRVVGGGFDVTVHRMAIEPDDLRTHLDGGLDEPDDPDALYDTEVGVSVSVVLGEPVLEQYHAALQVLLALAPDLLAAWDRERLRWVGRRWIRSAAESVAPPPPISLFTVHIVRGDGCVWLHTHGLQRCGAIELEVIEDLAPDRARDFVHLLNAMGMWMIDHGPPLRGEAVEVGRGMPVAWVPWSDPGLAWRPQEFETRADREHHGGLRGALVVVGERRRLLRRPVTVYEPIGQYAPLMDDDPVFYRSSAETRRMSQLACEHFSTFRRLLERHGDDGAWSFLVKLGYAVDGDGGHEHLWFEAHAFSSGRLDATLLNEPHMIERMASGDRDWHAVDQLTDWRISGPGGAFGPDRAAELDAAAE